MFPEWRSQNKQEKEQQSSSVRSEENNIHDPKKKRIISCIYIMSLLLYLIIMSVLLANSWNALSAHKLTDQFYFANQVAYQWKKGFITDIIVTSTSSCPQNYEHGLNYRWPGTNFGCYCELSENITFVLEGYCNPSLIQKNCHNMQSQQSIQTHFWKNNSNICVKRSSVSMLTEEKYDETKHHICGSSNGLVIMPKNQECPFVNVTFNEPTVENNKKVIEDGVIFENAFYGIYNATSPYSFYTYPIHDFMVSEYQFCLIQEDTGLDPSHSDFILLNIERGCAEVGNISLLGSLGQKQFYQNNPDLQTLTSIQGFPSPGSWEYHLGFSSIPSWTYSCRHNLDNKFSIENSRKLFNLDFQKQYSSLSIGIMILIGIIGIQFMVLAIRKLFHHSVYPVGYKKQYLPWDFFKNLIRYIVDMIVKLIILGMVFYLAYQSFYNWNWFKSAAAVNCSDDNPQINSYIITPYASLYLTVLQYGIAKVICCLSYLLIDIVHFIYIYKKQLKYYLIEPDGKYFTDKINETSKELNIENLDWVKKDNGKKDQSLFEFDENQRENNDFRVTMAVQNQSVVDEDEAKKPHIKRKKKPRGFLFNKKEDNEGEEENEKIEQINVNNDYNPFMLEEGGNSMFLNSDWDTSKREMMKQRKRR